MKDYMNRITLEANENWREWTEKIPSLRFASEWDVRIIPPFAGAIARFTVTQGEASVSVYLDVFEKLGLYGGPYWEIYPYDDDTMRYDMDDTDGLMEGIAYSLMLQQGDA